MAAIHKLAARSVFTAGIGKHADGGNLYLIVKPTGASWVFRYTAPSGRQREMGLGPCLRDTQAAAGASLTRARKAAGKAREVLDAGGDPLEVRRVEREAAKAADEAAKAEKQRDRATLARVAREYHERVIEPTKTAKHGAQWIASLENHVPPAIWHKPIADVSAPELLDWLISLQAKVPETASRIRQRLEVVFDDAEFRGVSAGNPARALRRKLTEASKRRERGHFAALDWQAVPAFMADLRGREAIAARALEFAILTAARTGEVIGAAWDEFDLDAAKWVVPASRMKAGEEHEVPLSERAVEIVRAMRAIRHPEQRHVFRSPQSHERPLSNMGMLTLLRRMGRADETTVHGLARASFSTWANETGAARPDVIEACLAHREADLVRRAYSRAKFAAERRALLDAWARYCAGEQPATAEVIEFKRGSA
ncbi:tyrosine-type recombinase/integrase [Zeimonas arvi]|uniref:DUF4102 domain-containing protein n=1 Tax=Zeimonas arvi TaxID=2498847 RepID=A0A5C8NMZ4_9BURK|nr:site-specific integrase [Zeimonas arvi]TXL62457.1 DUF4102 domain-containing protein [Zeimonas arvi]